MSSFAGKEGSEWQQAMVHPGFDPNKKAAVIRRPFLLAVGQ